MYCPDGKTQRAALCYNSCPDGYKYNLDSSPTFCVPKDDKGPFYTQTDTKVPQCADGFDKIGLICYRKCPQGLSRVPGVPTQCQGPRGTIYGTKTQSPKIISKDSHPASCKSNREFVDGLCYEKCSDKFGECYRANPSAVTECMPKNGVSYAPDIDHQNPCPDGYVFDGTATCMNSYVPETYGKRSIPADCTGNRDSINGSCYDQCPVGDNGIELRHADGLPTQCIPKRGLNYPTPVLIYKPSIRAKSRKVKMSTK
jgi:hypothetical protein